MVLWTNIYFQWTDNGYIAGAWAMMACYALTVFPIQIYDWWMSRHVRRAEYRMKKSAGIPYGWRRHLPWNSRKASAAAIRVPARVLDEPVVTYRPRGPLRRQRGADRRL